MPIHNPVAAVGGYTEGARVNKIASQAIGDSAWAWLIFDNETYDTDNIHDNVVNNDRLTCRTAGKYIIICNIAWAPSAVGSRYFAVTKNGIYISEVANYGPHATYNTYQIASTIYELAVGEYVQARVWQDSGGNLNVLSLAEYSAQFMMQRIG